MVQEHDLAGADWKQRIAGSGLKAAPIAKGSFTGRIGLQDWGSTPASAQDFSACQRLLKDMLRLNNEAVVLALSGSYQKALHILESLDVSDQEAQLQYNR
eukprot:gene34056-41999_t